MNRGPLIFLGTFLTFAFAWFGLIFTPYLAFERLDPVQDEQGQFYPRAPDSHVEHGRSIYQGMGCVYCHSQQVRPKPFASDIDRGWGGRRTVPLDYIEDRVVFLGTMRTGPDLANIGNRWDEVKQHKHLYNPRFEYPKSTMPAFRFLYEWKDESDVHKDDPLQAALEKKVPAGKPGEPEPWQWPTKPGKKLVPTTDARALVAYLLSLKKDRDLPSPKKP